jgi:hypothetical protein
LQILITPPNVLELDPIHCRGALAFVDFAEHLDELLRAVVNIKLLI